MTNTTEIVRCSFCNKDLEQVKRLIAGPKGIYICDKCVEICADIIREETGVAVPMNDTVKCHRCGQVLPNDAKFCYKCGVALIVNESSAKDMKVKATSLEKVITEDTIDELDYLSMDLCKKWNIDTSWSRPAYYSHCRRRGFSAYEKDEHFPEMSIDEVKVAMLKNTDVVAKKDGERRTLDKIGKIGPYVVDDKGMYFERNDIIHYRARGVKRKANILPVVKDYLGVQSLSIKDDKLIVRYMTNVRQTGWNEEVSIMGDMGSEFRDSYEADISEISINIF